MVGMSGQATEHGILLKRSVQSGLRLNHDKDLNRQGKKSARTGPNPKLYKVKLIWQLARLKMPLHIFEISELLAHGKSRLFSMIMATLYDKAAKAHRWKNHFEQLLNHPSVPCPYLPSTVQEDHLNWKYTLLFKN